MIETVLVNEAIKLFNEKGTDFTMSDLAQSLKMSKKTIYKHYENKEQVIGIVVDNLFASIEQKGQAIAGDATLDVVEKVKKIICIFPDYEKINYTHMFKIKKEYPVVYDKIEAYFDNNWDVVFGLIDQAVEEQRLRPVDHDNFKIIMLGTIKHLLELGVKDQEMKINQCVDMLFEGLTI